MLFLYYLRLAQSRRALRWMALSLTLYSSFLLPASRRQGGITYFEFSQGVSILTEGILKRKEEGRKNDVPSLSKCQHGEGFS